MGYTALYRKFRPILFSEIVGQEHITRTLKNQIIAGRVEHALNVMEKEKYMKKHVLLVEVQEQLEKIRN